MRAMHSPCILFLRFFLLFFLCFVLCFSDLPTMDDLFDSIINDEIDYDSHPWHCISAQAKDLLQGMLQRDPAKRLTAAQVGAPAVLTRTGGAGTCR